jgi:hypothetical protein
MNRFKRAATLGVGLIVLGLVAGCGNTAKSLAPGAPIDQATADDFAIQAVASLDVVGSDLDGAMGGSSAGPAMSPRMRLSRAAWDTTWTASNGLTFTASATFFDADGNELPNWSPAATRLHRTSTASGTLSGERDTATVGHSAEFDVRGIESGQDTLRVDGACLDTLLNRFHSLDGLRTRYFLWKSTVRVDSVRALKSGAPAHDPPISGAITLIVSADRLRSNNRGDVEVHFEATVEVVFGPNGAEVTVNSGYRFHWNPRTGAITRA